MLVPKVETIEPKETNKEFNEIEITNILEPVKLFYSINLKNDKEVDRMILNIERIVRTSTEYSRFIGFMKNKFDMTRCTYDPYADITECKKTKIEIHHYPFTLYDITKTVLMDYLKDDTSREINPYEIAETIMKLHYELIVGLVPLSITMHQLVHAGKKFINLKYVNQSYLKFIARYSNVMDPNLISNWRNLQMLSEQDDRGELAEEDYLEEVKLILHIDNIEKPEAIKTENEVIA